MDAELNQKEFEEACGVGVVVTDEHIEEVLDKLFAENMEKIKAKGH